MIILRTPLITFVNTSCLYSIQKLK